MQNKTHSLCLGAFVPGGATVLAAFVPHRGPVDGPVAHPVGGRVGPTTCLNQNKPSQDLFKPATPFGFSFPEDSYWHQQDYNVSGALQRELDQMVQSYSEAVDNMM